MRRGGVELHASFTFAVDHSMFQDVARRPYTGEFSTLYIKLCMVKPVVGLYKKMGGGKVKEIPSCPW